MLVGKEFDAVASNESGGAAMPELEPISQFGGFRNMTSDPRLELGTYWWEASVSHHDATPSPPFRFSVGIRSKIVAR